MATKLDYIRFVRAFDEFFEREGVDRMSSAPPKCEECGVPLEDSTCPDCGQHVEVVQEPYFSWSACECCGDSDGGNREDYVAFNVNVGDGPDVELEVSVCEDCVYFNEYGRLPDVPMEEVDADVLVVQMADGRLVTLDGEADGGQISGVEASGERVLVNVGHIDLEATEALAG